MDDFSYTLTVQDISRYLFISTARGLCVPEVYSRADLFDLYKSFSVKFVLKAGQNPAKRGLLQVC